MLLMHHGLLQLQYTYAGARGCRISREGANTNEHFKVYVTLLAGCVDRLIGSPLVPGLSTVIMSY
jgi:hypothetical protein